MSIGFAERYKLRFKVLKRDLREAVRKDDDRRVDGLIFKMGLSHLSVDYYPEKHFRLICSVIGSRAFARSPNTAKSILVQFLIEWNKLSSSQRKRLLIELERIYPTIKVRAWISCFMISELVGQNFRNKAALRMLLRLANIPREHARAPVAHGLEHIVRDSGDPELAAIALHKLTELAADPSDEVRNQVAESLLQIERSKPPQLLSQALPRS